MAFLTGDKSLTRNYTLVSTDGFRYFVSGGNKEDYKDVLDHVIYASAFQSIIFIVRHVTIDTERSINIDQVEKDDKFDCEYTIINEDSGVAYRNIEIDFFRDEFEKISQLKNWTETKESKMFILKYFQSMG